jgi:hypothetical protein
MRRRPFLWLPSSALQHISEARKDGPGLMVYDTISEVDPGLPDLAGVLVAKLASFDLETTLGFVSNVNARLLHDGHEDVPLHEQLERDLVYPDVMEKLGPVRASHGREQSVIFTRRALLLLAKIALGVARDGPGGSFDQREVGTCVLIINELLQKAEQSDDEFVIDMMTSWDLTAPLEVPHLVARFRLVFEHLRTSTHPTVVAARKRVPLDRLLFDDLTHAEFQHLLMGIYGIITKAVEARQPPVLVIEPPLPAWVGGEAKVRSFFGRRSQPMGVWADWRYGSSWSTDRLRSLLRDDFFLHDLTTFRRQPFIEIDGRYVLPDYRLAFERMTFGSYWTIFDALTTNQEKLSFSGAWGTAFEEYIVSLLDDVYPRSPLLTNVFSPNVKWKTASADSRPAEDGEIDGILDFVDHVIVLEVKSSLLTVDVRSSRSVEAFDKWIADRLIGNEKEKGGLRQLARSARAVRDGVMGAPRMAVYPVLVSDETAFQSLGVNRYLNRTFTTLVEDSREIRPLTVITTDELEKLLPCVGDGLVSWRGLLDRRAADRGGWLWIGQELLDELAAAGRLDQMRRNPVLTRAYADLFAEFRKSQHES